MKPVLLSIYFFIILGSSHSLPLQAQGLISWIKGPEHHKGVIFVPRDPGGGRERGAGQIEKDSTNLVRDTFVFRNTSQDTLRLKAYSQYKHFVVSEAVPPGQLGFIYYRRRILYDGRYYIPVMDSAILRDRDLRKLFSVRLDYMAVHVPAEMGKASPGKLGIWRQKYYLNNVEDLLLIFPNGMPRAWGLMYGGNTRVGTWQSWRSSGDKLPDTVYSKKFNLGVHNGVKGQMLKVTIHQNGTWKESLCSCGDEGFTIFVLPGTDSLHIAADSLSVSLGIDYGTLNEVFSYDKVHLLKPGQPFYHRRHGPEPVWYVLHEYALILQEGLSHKQVLAYLEDLKGRYPTVEFKFIPVKPTVIHARLLNPLAKDTTILSRLRAEDNIRQVSKAMGSDYKGAFTGEFRLFLKDSCTLDSLKKSISGSPFRILYTDPMYNHRSVHLQCSLEMLDERFLEAVNKLWDTGCVRSLELESVEIARP